MSDFLGIRSLKFSTVQTAAQFIFVYEISSWKRDDVFEWICRLDMPIPGLWVEIAEQLWDEHVDGESFLSTTYKDWFDFDVLCHVSIGLLIACRDVYRQLLIAGPVTDVFTGATKPSGPMQQPFPQPAGELSELHDMDIHCTDMAGLQEAFVYGQLIVLGNQRSSLNSTGASLVMERRCPFKLLEHAISKIIAVMCLVRLVANGLTFEREIIYPMNNVEKISTIFQPDMSGTANPNRDRFQIGRNVSSGCNDLVVASMSHPFSNGMPHVPSIAHKPSSQYLNGRFVNREGSCAGESSAIHGATSRYACRIECERNPPYRCLIYASGFDSNRDLFLSSSATLFRVPVDQNEAVGSRCDADIIDAVTATGVRMWSPEYKDWVEVTVRGNVCVPREHSRNSPGKVVSCRTNEIVSGSIVDLGGVYLLFQGAHQMKRQASAEAPHKMLFDINIQRPRCPVLFSTIAVQYTSDRDKLVNTYAKKFAMKLPGKVSSLDCKALDLSNGFGDSEIQSMSPHVFTSCGHVHAFSKELLGRPCPLCRVVGNFTEVVYPFLSSICHMNPTHVFNPCGHAASEEVCKFWSSFKLVRDSSNGIRFAACPFCMGKLCGSDNSNGHPYSKLIFQFE